MIKDQLHGDHSSRSTFQKKMDERLIKNAECSFDEDMEFHFFLETASISDLHKAREKAIKAGNGSRVAAINDQLKKIYDEGIK